MTLSTSSCLAACSLWIVLCAVVLQIGAFLTSPSQCIAVHRPSSPDPPFVVISAPGIVGNCDDLTLEGSATFASSGGSCKGTLIETIFHGKTPDLGPNVDNKYCCLRENRLTGTTNVTWDVTLADGDQSPDTSDITRVLEEVRQCIVVTVLTQHRRLTSSQAH